MPLGHPKPDSQKTPVPSLFSIGVVLFQTTRQQLEQLLRSINCMPDAEFTCDVHILDNSNRFSETELRDLVGALKLPIERLVWHESRGNIGFGRAHNRMMEAALSQNKAAGYLCVNPDGFFHPRALRHFAQAYTLYGPEGLYEMRQLPSEHPKPYNPMTGETPWCSGAALAIPREVYAALGGFDERFFMYCEDVDLSWRSRLAGFFCRVIPDAYFYHSMLGRPVSLMRRRELLIAGRYLAWKWRAGAFCESMTHTLLNEHPGGSGPLPLLDEGDQLREDIKRLRRISDFDHLFDFCEPRWNL